jgi:molybdopterin-guanine dinucleotide biosynthesis protein A
LKEEAVPPVADITGVILAGGASSRFGENKALAIFLGEPLIRRVARVMDVVFQNTLLVTNTPEVYSGLGLQTVRDEVPGQGPLGGIVTAFEHTVNDYIFVAACDMPLLNAMTVERVMAQGFGRDAAIASHDGINEYLLALYSRNVLRRMRCCLGEDNLSLKEFCSHLSNVAWVPVDGDAWFNVNTKKDLEFLENNHAD